MNVRNYGIYNLQFSAQLVNTDSQIHDIDIWFRKNGTNIAGSNSRYSVPNSHGGVDGHMIAALNFFIELNANDYKGTKTDGIKIRGTGAATKGVMARGPMA